MNSLDKFKRTVARAATRGLVDLAVEVAGKNAPRLLSDLDRYWTRNEIMRALPDEVVDGKRTPTTQRQREFLRFASDADPFLNVLEVVRMEGADWLRIRAHLEKKATKPRRDPNAALAPIVRHATPPAQGSAIL